MLECLLRIGVSLETLTLELYDGTEMKDLVPVLNSVKSLTDVSLSLPLNSETVSAVGTIRNPSLTSLSLRFSYPNYPTRMPPPLAVPSVQRLSLSLTASASYLTLKLPPGLKGLSIENPPASLPTPPPSLESLALSPVTKAEVAFINKAAPTLQELSLSAPPKTALPPVFFVTARKLHTLTLNSDVPIGNATLKSIPLGVSTLSLSSPIASIPFPTLCMKDVSLSRVAPSAVMRLGLPPSATLSLSLGAGSGKVGDIVAKVAPNTTRLAVCVHPEGLACPPPPALKRLTSLRVEVVSHLSLRVPSAPFITKMPPLERLELVFGWGATAIPPWVPAVFKAQSGTLKELLIEFSSDGPNRTTQGLVQLCQALKGSPLKGLESMEVKASLMSSDVCRRTEEDLGKVLPSLCSVHVHE
ncbi:hypothetical protein KIPB_007713 [Kipferlia bialata]|uniref:Uncharacterized protein n=1 Tax=Kipferlia bialata TaxID=797122 RepID=A0A9K3CZ07_9EUKA|nr:hypothetical protein KIPB_007713 [Kipferlia bialata]|eukprot:g7713.t1